MKPVNGKETLVLGLALLLLLITPVSRQILHDGLPVGEQAYSELVSAQSPGSLYYWLLGLVEGFPVVYLFVLMGVASLLVFYSLITRFGPEERTLMALLLVTSPAFIYTFSSLNVHAFSVLLMLVAIKLLIENKEMSYPALFILLVTATLSLFGALLALIVLFIYFNARKSREAMAALLASFFMVLLYYIMFNPEKIIVSAGSMSRQFFSSTGAISGYSLLFALLAIIGFLALWKKKSMAYSALVFLLAAYFFFGSTANTYLVFVLSVFAGEGLYLLLKRRWALKFIKHLSMAIIILGVLFSTATYYPRLVSGGPDKAVVESFEAMEDLPDGMVLSHCSNTYWINYFSVHKAFIDDCSEKQKMETAKKIFYATDIEAAQAALKENGVRYIWIDPDMKRGQVWDTAQQGLLFLFRNSETFKNIYRGSGIEVWQVLE